MPLIEFPNTINNLAERGTFTRKPGNPNRNSQYDSGPDRSRQRFSNVPDTFGFKIKLSGIECMVLDGFYKYVVKYGTLWFKMPVVIANTYLDAECRFVKDTLSFNDAGFDVFEASVNIEVRNAPASNRAYNILYEQYGPIKGPTGVVIIGPPGDPDEPNDDSIYLVDSNSVYIVDDSGKFITIGN